MFGISLHCRLTKNLTARSACDARSIGELQGLNYPVPGLPKPPIGLDSDGHPLPHRYIISSPNMLDLPDLSQDSRFVYVRQNGRFGTADFSLCPQWYFVGTDYLPFIRRRPSIPLDEHPYGVIWYNLADSDFILEPGANKIGRIPHSLVQRFRALSDDLRKRAEDLILLKSHSSFDIANLRHCMESMKFAVVILECAPQTFQLTLLTVTGFQRYYLEVLACYEYLTIFRDRPISDNPTVDPTIMGTITYSLEIAQRMFSKGVPVWLVRSPDEFASSTPIFTSTLPRNPPEAMVPALCGSQPVFKGEASAIQNRACQAIKVGNVRHGHTAYALIPGDFNLQNCLRGNCFSLTRSLIVSDFIYQLPWKSSIATLSEQEILRRRRRRLFLIQTRPRLSQTQS